MLKWDFKHYKELSLDEFHDILALRINVFVVEQNCPYQEIDGKDKDAHHLLCKNEHGKIVGTLRVLPSGSAYETVGIGRIVLDPTERGNQQGHQMMQEAMNFVNTKYGNIPVKLSAQKHLEGFYKKHKFKSTNKEYLEDGIPHVLMEYLP